MNVPRYLLAQNVHGPHFTIPFGGKNSQNSIKNEIVLEDFAQKFVLALKGFKISPLKILKTIYASLAILATLSA